MIQVVTGIMTVKQQTDDVTSVRSRRTSGIGNFIHLVSNMADAQQVSSLPLPPPQYYRQYTDEAIQRGTTPRPPAPVLDRYQMFGSDFHCDDLIIRPLESQGISRLYPPDVDRRRELKKLNLSILVNFLDLLEVLARNPANMRREEKLEDLKLLFVHAHHLVNEFRPHQARETLRVLLEVQRRQRRDAAQRFKWQLERAREVLGACRTTLSSTLPEIETRPATEPGEGDATERVSPLDGERVVREGQGDESVSGGENRREHDWQSEAGPQTLAKEQILDTPSRKDVLLCEIVDAMT
uniref:Mediator of RNA polymerase II transcription subunit 7 n=2 Tax=Eptatretus burgeri TaxID=7764 RepID=A0A8C4QGU8_EPTBU